MIHLLEESWINAADDESISSLFYLDNHNKVLLTARILISAAYLSMRENEKAHEFIPRAKMLFGKDESIDQLKPLVYYILIQIYYEIGEFDEALGIIHHFCNEGGEASPFSYRMNICFFAISIQEGARMPNRF